MLHAAEVLLRKREKANESVWERERDNERGRERGKQQEGAHILHSPAVNHEIITSIHIHIHNQNVLLEKEKTKNKKRNICILISVHFILINL